MTTVIPMWPFNRKKEKYVLTKGDYTFQYGVEQLLEILSQTVNYPAIIESRDFWNEYRSSPLSGYVHYASRSAFYTAANRLVNDSSDSISTFLQGFELNEIYLSPAFENQIADSDIVEKCVRHRDLRYYSEMYFRIDLAHQYIGLEFAVGQQELVLGVLEKLRPFMQIDRI